MKKIIIYFLIIQPFLINGIFAKKRTSLRQEVRNINSTLIKIQKRIDKNTKFINDDSITKKIQSTDKKFDYYQSFLSNIGLLIGIFAIIFTLVTITLSIFGFILTFRARNAIKQAKEDTENFIKNYEKEQIEEAIKNLEKSDYQTQYNSSLFLSLKQYIELSDNQLFRIYELLQNDLEEQIKPILKNLLANHNSRYSIKYFFSIADNTDADTNLFYLANFIVKNEFEDNINLLKKYITNRAKGLAVINLLNTFNVISKKWYSRLLNNKEINDILSDEDVIEIGQSQNNTIKNSPYINEIQDGPIFSRYSILQQKISSATEKEDKEKKEKVSNEAEIISRYELRIKGNDIEDRYGNKYTKKLWAPSMIGIQEVFEGIKVENKIIKIEKIKEIGNQT